MKKIFCFDLDGTLAESKSIMDDTMGALIAQLTQKAYVAVIGGGMWQQFDLQFLTPLAKHCPNYQSLFLLPKSGSSFYRYTNGTWNIVYEYNFNDTERAQILEALKEALAEIDYKEPSHVYGKIIEDRGSQITFSALGQEAPVAEKEAWNKMHDIRPQLQAVLAGKLPNCTVRRGGLTSIDITKAGINKAYGVRELFKTLTLSIEEGIYIGDALYEGGNDEVVKETGIETHPVATAEETKDFIMKILAV